MLGGCGLSLRRLVSGKEDDKRDIDVLFDGIRGFEVAEKRLQALTGHARLVAAGEGDDCSLDGVDGLSTASRAKETVAA